MQPFDVPSSLASFKDPYPLPSTLLQALICGSGDVSRALAQLWLSEGIPAAFEECPAVYDEMRTWLGDQLQVHAKEVGVVGSARLGRSIAPRKLDRKFGAHSDLDLFVVSRPLFDRVSIEALRWRDDFVRGRVHPRSDLERKYWSDNRDRCPRSIERWGFLDSNRIPNLRQYPVARQIAQTMFLLRGKLSKTRSAPTVKGASLRCYVSWASAVSRIRFNLLSASRTTPG